VTYLLLFSALRLAGCEGNKSESPCMLPCAVIGRDMERRGQSLFSPCEQWGELALVSLKG